MSRGKTVKQKDGTEYTPLTCPVCKKRLIDVKIPNEVFFGQQELEAS